MRLGLPERASGTVKEVVMMTDSPTPMTGTDGYSWRHPLVPAIYEAGGFRHFDVSARPSDVGGVARSPLVRGSRLSVYVQDCLEGQGEVRAHAHADEASWLVLSGEAEFFDAADQRVARVRGGEGLAVAPRTTYRYVCHGDHTIMVRIAARTEEDLDTM